MCGGRGGRRASGEMAGATRDRKRVQAREAKQAKEAKGTSSSSSSSSVAGRVWRLSRDPRGCRRVQEALAKAATDDERAALAAELKGHVWEAMVCPHANHVLQQCITIMRAASCSFIVKELEGRGTGAICEAARHAFGCRVLQRLLEHWPSHTMGIAEDLLSEGLLLCRHTYGNFVMQQLLEHGCEEQRSRLVRSMAEHALALGPDPRAGASLAKAVEHASDEDRAALARALLGEKRVLMGLACSRHGHIAVEDILELCEESECEEAIRQLTADLDTLRECRYGRSVANVLCQLTKVGDELSSPIAAQAVRGGA